MPSKLETATNEAASDPAEPKQEPAGAKYVAQNTVYFEGMLYEPGETVELDKVTADKLGASVKPA